LLIEIYFQQIYDLIQYSTIADIFNLDCEKRGFYEGFIRGKIKFKNNAVLHLREFVYVEISIDRKMYSYQYMDSKNNLLFRYDIAGVTESPSHRVRREKPTKSRFHVFRMS